MKAKQSMKHRWSWAFIPPWIIIGAAILLIPLFAVMTMQSLNRQKTETTRLLLEKGEALIRSFEAGARTGAGLRWDAWQLQKLLIETAQQPGIDYFIITNAAGTILADSDPYRIGDFYGTDLDLKGLATKKTIQWRQVANTDGADTFEVFRRFTPTPEPFAIWEGTKHHADFPGFVIFVGMDMGPVLAARKADEEHTIWMAVLLIGVGLSGVISLLLAQGYKTTRKSLSRVQAFSDHLMENIPMGLVVINPQGKIITFNKTASAILALPVNETGERATAAILPSACLEIVSRLAEGNGLIAKEMDCPLRNGQTVPLEIIASRLQDPQGEILGVVILLRDISDLLAMKGEIARTQHLAALGSLAAGVAHEIRNPLSSIKGFATYFKERYREIPADRETAEIMIGEVERLNRVIGQLLEFARPTTLHLEKGSIPALVKDVLKIITGEMGEREIVLERELTTLPDISFDKDKMKQVFLNLFLNALEAMNEGGSLTVKAGPLNEQWLQIEIIDTGTGIAKEDLGRIFDPYFTTKPSGTGLGMAIVQKILTAHHGEIKLESEPGKGTRTIILLPSGSEETLTNDTSAKSRKTPAPRGDG
ncbi:MAG: ATP-binding protein [Syntrophales bacterium]|nr:ATP-binding protein [Syntrophales bacterium]MCK9391207.1 ATP-binding protein [Syntrophales bacterium]